MKINPESINPIDFYYSHQDDEATVTSSFPGGVPYFIYSRNIFVHLEKFLQDHRDKIVDARYCSVRKSYLDAMKEKDRDRYQAQFCVDGECPEDSLAHKTLSEGNMYLMNVVADFSDETGKAFCLLNNRRNDCHASGWKMRIVAQTSERLDLLAEMMVRDYYFDSGDAPIRPKVAKLGLLKTTPHGLGISDVTLSDNRLMEDDSLELHFGTKIHKLQSHLKQSLCEHSSGFHLLQGAPGTGKTSFLNHLTATLAATHRLIYLPISSFHLMSSPDAIGFWIRLAQGAQTGQKNVLLIEDAEGLIQSREEINVSQGSLVSTLLNLTDGLLGNVLNLHVIATINTDYDKIDTALLRAGRLRTYYEFERLDYAQAVSLADHLKVVLPVEQKQYTLADIYNGGPKKPTEKTGVMGFQSMV